jgi:hypothetical protein
MAANTLTVEVLYQGARRCLWRHTVCLCLIRQSIAARSRMCMPSAALIFNTIFFPTTKGFVHSTLKADEAPGQTHVLLAHKMFSKKNKKKTRALHPLFARGFETPLQLTVRGNLFVFLCSTHCAHLLG